MVHHLAQALKYIPGQFCDLPDQVLASFPGLLTPAFVACSTNPALVLQATNAGVRRPGNEANQVACTRRGINSQLWICPFLDKTCSHENLLRWKKITTGQPAPLVGSE